MGEVIDTYLVDVSERLDVEVTCETISISDLEYSLANAPFQLSLNKVIFLIEKRTHVFYACAHINYVYI